MTEMGNEKYMCCCSLQTEREEATWWIDSCGCTWEIGSVRDIILGNWSKCDCIGSNYGLLMRSCEQDNCKYLVVLKSGVFFPVTLRRWFITFRISYRARGGAVG